MGVSTKQQEQQEAVVVVKDSLFLEKSTMMRLTDDPLSDVSSSKFVLDVASPKEQQHVQQQQQQFNGEGSASSSSMQKLIMWEKEDHSASSDNHASDESLLAAEFAFHRGNVTENLVAMGYSTGDIPSTNETIRSSSNDRKRYSTGDIPSKRQRRRNSSVSFAGGVQIRHYERILDVNPGVTNGAPIGIGWKYVQEAEQITVEEWESRRTPFKKCCLEEMKLSRQEREQLLRASGYRQHEIAQGIRLVLKAQHQRAQTVRNLKHAKMEEVMERATRKLKKFIKQGFLSFSSSRKQ